MNIVCGTDIIEINRIKEAIEKSGETFLNEIYTALEIEYCESKKNAKYQHYAARFAAKEAVFKAISKILDNKFNISWKEIQITNNSQGKPNVNFINKKIEKLKDIDISISHCKEYTTAFAIAIIEDTIN